MKQRGEVPDDPLNLAPMGPSPAMAMLDGCRSTDPVSDQMFRTWGLEAAKMVLAKFEIQPRSSTKRRGVSIDRHIHRQNQS
jgi:hypothetical protein